MAQTEVTVEDLRAAARRAYEGGDTAAAQRLIASGRALEAQGVTSGFVQDNGQIIAREPLIPTAEGSVPVEAPPSEDQAMFDAIMSDYVGPVVEGVGYLGQEFGRGVTQMAGAPVDMVNMSPLLLNLLPGEQGMRPFSDNPIGGSQNLWDVVTTPRDIVQDAAGLPVGDAQPQNAALRFGGRVMNELGAASLPVTAGLSFGRAIGAEGARTMQRSPNMLAGATGDYLERFAVAPAGTVRNEALLAAGAGSGAGLAQFFVDDGDPTTRTPTESLAEFIGSLLGVYGTNVTQNIYRGAENVARATLGGEAWADDVVREAVTSELARAMNLQPNMAGAVDTDPVVAAIRAQGNDAEQVVPGFRDTLADRTKMPGVEALEYARTTGPNAGNFLARRQQNTQAANFAIEDMAPQSTPAPFRTALDDAADQMIADSQARLAVAQTDFETAISDLNVAMSSEGRGETIRSALDTALRAAREVEDEAWSEIRGQVDTAPLSTAFEAITARLQLPEQRAVSDMMGAMSDPKTLAEAGAPADVAAVTTLRSEFTGAIREARAAGDTNRARVLGQYVDAIDEFLNADPAMRDALANARAVSLDLNDRFTRTGSAIADTLATRPSGGPRVPPDAVPRRFIQPDTGAAREVDSLLQETVNDPAVLGAVRDQIIADVRSRGLLDKPDQLNAYLGQFSRVFQRFPELRDQLGTAASLRRTLSETETSAANVQRSVEPGARTPVGQYRRFGQEDAVNSIRTVVSADQPDVAVRELLQTAGRTPENVESLRSAFWDFLRTRAQPTTATNRMSDGTDPWNFNRLYAALEDPKMASAARELYADNPEHLDNLRTIAETLRGTNTAMLARAPGSSGTPQSITGNGVLPSTETLGAYSFAYQRGQIGAPYIALRVLSTVMRNATRRGREEMFGRVLDRALLDPDFAATLLEDYNPAVAEILSRNAVGWFGAQADEFRDLLTPPDEEAQGDEVEQAIIREDQ